MSGMKRLFEGDGSNVVNVPRMPVDSTREYLKTEDAVVASRMRVFVLVATS